jgi:hypothetical protein
MPVILGAAREDCSYKDPHSLLIIAGKEGCPRQAQFKIWIQSTVDNAFKDKPIFACRSHAGVLFQKMKEMAQEMRRMGEKVVVMVEDITLSPDAKRRTKLLVTRDGKTPTLLAVKKGS